jgi:putative flippase GtrA
LHVALASGIAFTAAVTSNFIWNRYWTYPDSRSRRVSTQMAQFFFISTVAVVFRLILVSATYASLGTFAEQLLGNRDIEAKVANQLGTNIAQAIAIIVALFWNFFMNRIWTYSDVKGSPVAAGSEGTDARVDAGSLTAD